MPRKYMPNALTRNAEKQWNQNRRMAKAIFVRIAAPRTPDLHSKANLREILGVWQRSLCMLCRS